MRLRELKSKFMEVVAPSLPNEWEVEDVLFELVDLPDDILVSILEQVGVIWPISHSLCFAYLSDGKRGFKKIPPSLFAEWSRRILELYEAGGLLVARKFLIEPENQFLARRQGLYGVSFIEIVERMQYYVSGVAGRNIRVVTGGMPTTDTVRIVVPEMIDLFPTQAENTLFYKLILSLQLINIEMRCNEEVVDSCGNHSRAVSSLVFSQFDDKELARDLLLILWLLRGFRILKVHYPGLFRVAEPLCLELVGAIESQGEGSERCHFIKEMLQTSFQDLQDSVLEGKAIDLLPGLYKEVVARRGGYFFGDFATLLGVASFDNAASEIERRRVEQKNTFVALLSRSLAENSLRDEKNPMQANNSKVESDTTLLVVPDEDTNRAERLALEEDVLLDNGSGELSDELKELIVSIENDLGELPEAYVQAAVGMAGRGVNNRDSVAVQDREKETSDTTGFSYDEWDYRRGGYRRSWCTLYEKPVSPVKSTIIEETLQKYRGQLHKIRRQFEMLRTQQRFVRRRRYGDDIDFDALVDALGDAKAGLVPSDRLFMRLLRDQREITSYFLVDMSNSTEGWVGTAVKEALILMSEAMEIVGDPYAIYGFSGMRRSKSEVFPVKEVGESYNHTVRARIAGIAPKEYTRMGPPIRHMTKKILERDSKIRLLIIFSDGKPEDYDDYKGQYAIEDTRKAILEAKGAGIHVFCVTIDSTAHDYLDHMYGGGNYIYVDNVNVLPGKMVELYRLLTR